MPPLNEDIFVGLPNLQQVLRVGCRLGVACVLGAVLGLERQWRGKNTGLRTHMLVALGSALFIVATVEADISRANLSRVIQGLATGIGFLGAGTILKLGERRLVLGLTTAAGIWVTAAVGMAVGLGLITPAVCAVILAWFILTVLGIIERWFRGRAPGQDRESTEIRSSSDPSSSEG
jgi:putative Mg2+ transporter-C (MgtC) family protein